MADNAFGKLKVIPLNRHAGIRGVERQETVGVGRIERQFLAGVQGPQKPDQLATIGGQHTRVQLGEA